MLNLIRKFEYAVKVVLMFMMVAVIVAATVELGVIIVRDLLKPPFMLLTDQEIIKIFGFFLMVLIGLELLESMKVFLAEEKMHTDVVFLVALIAIARKVIILDLDKYGAGTLLGIAAIITGLAVGYYLFKLTRAKSEKKG